MSVWRHMARRLAVLGEHRRRAARRAGRGAALSLALVATGACEHDKLTEADCALVKGRLESSWERDAVAAQRKATSDVFLQFVREERDRIGSDWMLKCTPLVGRDVSPRELACLGEVDTIDDVYECSR